MITILKNDETGETRGIELTDVLKQKRIAQTFNDPLDIYIFFHGASHRVTCVAITPVEQPVADLAQSIVTTRSIEPGKIIKDNFRAPDSREDILAAFKAQGHDANIPTHLRRSPFAQLGAVIGRVGGYVRRALNVSQPA